MSDHPGIFARLAGALALAGANVVDARTYTSSDGVATAAFWIQDQRRQALREARGSPGCAPRSRARCAARSSRASALRDKDRIKRRERDFFVPTRISFDNTGSDIYTIVEVETRDRPGLLYDLARTLTANNVSIASAIIATYGKQAVDVFYVKDLFGLKLHAESKRRSLETRLRAAIAPAGPHADAGRLREPPDPAPARLPQVGSWTLLSRAPRPRARHPDGRLPRRRAGGAGLPDRLHPAQHVPPLLRRGRLQPRLRADVRQEGRDRRGSRTASPATRSPALASC